MTGARALRSAVLDNVTAGQAKGASGSGPKLPLRADVACCDKHERHALDDGTFLIVCGWTGVRTIVAEFVSQTEIPLTCPECFDPETGERTNRRKGHPVGTRYPATRGWSLHQIKHTCGFSCRFRVMGEKRTFWLKTKDRAEAERLGAKLFADVVSGAVTPPPVKRRRTSS